MHQATMTFLPLDPALEEIFSLLALTYPSHWRSLPLRWLVG